MRARRCFKHADLRSTLLPVASLLIGLAMPVTAVAQQEIDDRRPVNSDVQLEINEIIVGDIRVVGWETNELLVTGTIGADVDEFVVEGGPESVEIYADWDEWDNDDGSEDRRRRWRGRGRDRQEVDVTLEIRVPHGATLEINGITASVYVDQVDGAIEIETITGGIEYSGNATTIELTSVTGSIIASTASLMEGNFETVNGEIRFEGDVAPGADLNFEAVNGSVELLLPADVSASFDIETMMGEIANDFGEQPRRTSRWVPSQELSFRTGSGDADISIETLQGAVRIRRH